MPLLYGEGTRAFVRLQEEIIKTSDDQSIFAWKEQTLLTHDGTPHSTPDQSTIGAALIASTPATFKNASSIIS
jgi:hypothetical protein